MNISKFLYTKKRGFTLVEILVVLAIIAILIAISGYGASILQRNSRELRRQKSLNDLKLAIEKVYITEGKYPNLTASDTIVFDTATNSWKITIEGTPPKVTTMNTEKGYYLQPGTGDVSTKDQTIYCYYTDTSTNAATKTRKDTFILGYKSEKDIWTGTDKRALDTDSITKCSPNPIQ